MSGKRTRIQNNEIRELGKCTKMQEEYDPKKRFSLFKSHKNAVIQHTVLFVQKKILLNYTQLYKNIHECIFQFDFVYNPRRKFI